MEENNKQEALTRPELTEADIAELAKVHGNAILRTILKRVRNPPDAEDIFQSALCVALRVRKSFLWQSSPQTWLCGIALNLVRNYFARSDHFRYHFEDEAVLDHIADEGRDPESIVTRDQTTQLLASQIEAMPPDMRKTLALVAEENHSYEQAAEVMGIPIGTVRSRIFRARDYLRKAGGHAMLAH